MEWGTMSTLDVVNLKNQVYPTLDESTKKRPLKFFFLTQANKMFLLKTKPLLFSIIAMSQNLWIEIVTNLNNLGTSAL